MLHDIMANPWRVDDSDTEESVDHRLYRRVSFTPTAPLPNMASRPSTPRIADWDPVVVDDRNKKKIGRRKTAPSLENAPSNHKPIFSGTRDLRSPLSTYGHDELNTSMMMMRARPTTPALRPDADYDFDFDPQLLLEQNLNAFIHKHIPKNYSSFIHCSLRRDRIGIQKGFFPTFYLQFERPADGKKILVMAARKVARLDRQSEYIITTDIETLSEKSGGHGYIGKLRENNVTGTEYTLYDNGKSPNKDARKNANCTRELRRELAGIVYNTNLLGMKGPRQMKVFVPKLERVIQPTESEDTIIDRWRERNFTDVIQLQNRLPRFSEDSKRHVIHYEGNRMVLPSIKNFQMLMEGENNYQDVVMQFGRTDEDTFICDYRYPLNAVQAFGIALSSFDKRIARE